MSELAVRNVTKQFDSFEILKNISLEIADGNFLVLVGPSGCGKSTLLSIIAGLERQTSESILIHDRPVDDLESKERDIAMVFQSYALYPAMTIEWTAFAAIGDLVVTGPTGTNLNDFGTIRIEA